MYNKKPVDHLEGKWEKGRKYTLFSLVENNGTLFRATTAGKKGEPYVIYDSTNETFSANEGWEIVELSEDSRLSAMGGNGGSKTPNISIGTVTTVEPGEPAAASMSGTPEAPVLNLSIPKGLVGDTPNITVGTVTTGEPGTPVVVTITGTAEAPVLNITIPQGAQGNTGSSVEYPYELVNNLTTDDATKGLSAAQGKVLDGKVSQLEAEVNYLGGYYNKTVPTWTQGKRIGEDGSIINSGTQLYASDFITVKTGVTTTVYGIRAYTNISMPSVHFYNSSQVHIGYKYVMGTGDITTEIASLGASYIRLSTYDDENYPVADAYVEETAPMVLATPQYVENKIDEAIDETPIVEVQRNTQYPDLLEGYRDSVNGYYLANGELSANANWCSMTQYLPITAGVTYSLARQYRPGLIYPTITVCYYKSDKTYISNFTGTANNGFTAPSNAAYLRISIPNSNYDPDSEDNFDNIFLAVAADGNSVHTIDTAPIVVNGFGKTSLFGKTWAVFGDSITEKNVRSNLNYHDYIRSEMNVIVTNYGLGGSGYKNRDDNGNAFYQLVYQNRNALKDFDLITVMGGVNDCGRSAFATDIGTINDTFQGTDYSGATSNSIFACFKKTIELVFEYAPLVHIAIISPLPAVTNGFNFNPNDDTNNMSVFVEGCKEICQMYGIPYLDLYHESGLRPWDNTVNAQFFSCISADSPDRLHPNQYGHKWIYPLIREFIKKLG